MAECEKIWLSSPTMHGEEQAFVKEAFDTNWIAPLGKNVTEFENEMAAFLGIKAAAAMTAGTHALHLAVKLAGVSDGDIVLCHDLHETTVDSMERVIPKLIEEGYQLVTVSELMEHSDQKVQPGELYTCQ